jgi:hypothetical protein
VRGSALRALPQPLQRHHPNQPGLSVEPHPTVDVQARMLGSASTCLRGWRGTTERLDDRGRRNETTSSSLDAVTHAQSARRVSRFATSSRVMNIGWLQCWPGAPVDRMAVGADDGAQRLVPVHQQLPGSPEPRHVEVPAVPLEVAVAARVAQLDGAAPANSRQRALGATPSWPAS